jgi:hypothetical protein
VVSEPQIHRVTVRGRFSALTDAARRYLVAAQPEHDIFVSAYTEEGTFTYDERIAFFNLRYEVRGQPDSVAAGQAGLMEAERFLTTMGFGFHQLKADVVDVTAIWNDLPANRQI